MNIVPLALAAAVCVSAWSPSESVDPALLARARESASYIGEMQAQPPAEEPEENGAFTINLSIAGDCLLATYKGQRYQGSFSDYAATRESGYFLEKVQDIFASDDFTIVNLENVLTDRSLKEAEKSSTPAYWFKAPTANTKILAGSGVEAVSLANNHTGDYGAAGSRDTVEAVRAAGLEYGDNGRTFYLEKNGFRIAVICHGLWNEAQAGAIAKRIQAAEAESDFQIVFYHGGTEGVHTPEDWRVRASRVLVDAGADLVLGNHPHVLQPRETYKGVEIVYSLGNFCFGGSRQPKNRTVIYQSILRIEDGELAEVSSELIPCYVHTGASVNNYRPAVIEDEEQRQRVLDFMDGRSKLPY